ncbi:MAG: hypothetical protein ACR2KV_01420 [Solirubrobacteraceae bacterium]
MVGRKPKPVEQKRSEGNPGGRPLGDPVIIGGRVAPVMPAYLSVGAKKAWRETVPALTALEMLDRVDGPAVEALSVSIDLMRRAAGELKRCERFGLDPSTRTSRCDA